MIPFFDILVILDTSSTDISISSILCAIANTSSESFIICIIFYCFFTVIDCFLKSPYFILKFSDLIFFGFYLFFIIFYYYRRIHPLSHYFLINYFLKIWIGTHGFILCFSEFSSLLSQPRPMFFCGSVNLKSSHLLKKHHPPKILAWFSFYFSRCL